MYGLEPVKRDDVVEFLSKNISDPAYADALFRCLELAIDKEFEAYLNGSCENEITYEDRVKRTAKFCLDIFGYILKVDEWKRKWSNEI